MKYLKKTLAVFLAVLTMLSIISTATSVFAAEYTENKVRAEYFDSTLSGYLKDIVDTDGAVKITEKEEVDETLAATEQRKSARSTPMRKAAPQQETESADPDIDHTRLTLDLGDGESTAYLFSEPISFIDDNGELVYKDTNIEAVTDEALISRGYTYQNGDNDYKMYFSDDSEKGVLLVLKDGTEIKLVSNGDKTTGQSEKNTIDKKQTDVFTYSNAYGSNTTLRFIPQLNGIKDEIILEKYNGKNSFEFTLDVGENTAAINSKDEIEIIDSNKEIIQTFAAPFAYDAVGNDGDKDEHYTDCTYSLEKRSDGIYTLSINVPEEYLTSKNTVYPVTIDPTTGNVMVTNDAGVYSAKADNTYGSEVNACVGKTGTSEYGKGRAMFFFRVPADIKSYAKISSAKLWLRETTGRTATTYVRPYLNKEAWASTVTWKTQPAHYSTFTYPGKTGLTLARRNINSASTDKADNPYWYGFDITNAVRAWTTGTSNKGLKFIAECEAADGDYLWRAFATKEHSTSAYRPYAVISYTNDTTAPTISSVSGNPTSCTKNDVTLTVTATDDVYGAAGIASYSFDNGKTWQTSNSKKFTSNQTVNIKVKDKAGNISAAKAVKITKIDKTAPTISKVALSPSSWTNGSVKVTVTASDAGCGLHKEAYSFDNGATWQAANNKTYTANNSKINIKVRDALGNIATYASNPVKVDKIDKTAPTITITYSPSTPTNGDVTATITIKDDKALGKYKIGTGSEVAVSGTSKTITKKYTNNATEDITVWDAAGNPTKKTIKVANIDRTIPKISSVLGNPTSWTNQNVTLIVPPTDEDVEYSFDGGNTWSKSNSKEFTSNQTVVIKVKDVAGNISAPMTVVISKIDKVKPIINSVVQDPPSWGNEIWLYVNATDNSTKVQYSFDGGYTWQNENFKDFYGNEVVQIKVRDEAGNESEIKEKVIDKFDSLSPVITAVDAPSDWTNQTAVITVHAKDYGGSGLALYSFDDGQTWQKENTYKCDSHQFIGIIAMDSAGNMSPTWYQEVKVDKIPPDIEILGSCTDWTNKTVLISIGGDDVGGSHIWGYSFNGGKEWISGSALPFSKTTNRTLDLWAQDNAGNITKKTAKLMIDMEEPIIKSVSVTPNTKWHKGRVTVSVDATDKHEGIDVYSDIAAYSFDGGVNWQDSNIATYSEETENIIVAVKDNAGNISYYMETKDGVSYTTDIGKATPIKIGKFDDEVPTAPDIFAENGTVYISSRSFNFNEDTESPEHLEYKLGENGTWTAYEDALTLVNTYDVTVYARVRDEAGNISDVSSFVVKSTLGEYTTSCTDIAYGEGVFPVPFERTYSSTNGWFFSFNANIQPFTNSYIFTDFSGGKHYFIKNGEEKYVSADGDELELNIDNYAFKVPYGELTCYFNADGKIAFIKDNYITAEYAWTSSNLTIEDKSGRATSVSFDDNNKPDDIFIRDKKTGQFKNIKYSWNGNNLTSFTDAANNVHSYTYNANGLLTSNETETIDYSSRGRVKRITQQNGAFVKFTYNDTFAKSEDDTQIGKVTVADSKGVTDTWYYKDGITIASSLDNYSDEATYDPENISNALTEDTVANVAYALKFVADESEDAAEDNSGEGETPLYERLSDGSYIFYKYDSLNRAVMSVEIPTGVYFNITQNTTFDDALEKARVKTIMSYCGNTKNIAEWETSKLKVGIWKFVNTEKESYTYYENGEIESLESYTWADNDWKVVLKEEYDNKGNTTSKEEYKYGNEVTITKTLCTYDEKDRIVEQTVSTKTGTNDFVNSTKEEYKYNLYGDVDTHTVSQWLSNVWYQTYYEEYEYDGYGNNTKKTEIVSKNTFNPETNLVETTNTQTVTDYVYDVWNQPVKTTVQKGNETEVVTNVVYDILGRTTSVIEDGKTTDYTYDNRGNVLTVINEAGTTTYVYDASGKLLSRTDPDGKQASYTYDSYGNTSGHEFNGYSFTYNTLGSILTAGSAGSQLVSYTYSNNVEQNVLNSAFGNGQNVSYTYDEDGRITATKLGEETKYGYAYFDEKDADGKVTKEWMEISDYVNNLKKTVEENKTTVKELDTGYNVYSYETVSKNEEDENSFDGVKSRVYRNMGQGYETRYGEDKDRYIAEFARAERTFKYDDSGILKKTSFEDYLTTEYKYNSDNLIHLLDNTLADIKLSYSYSYDDDGRITGETLHTTSKDENGATVVSSETTNYAYDQNYQLSSAENSTTKWVYSYDGRGNILSKKEYTVSVDENSEKIYTEAESDSYVYDEIWKDKLASFNGQTITYDASGNPTNYLGHNMSWTMGRELASFDGITYTYNEDGIRTSKTVNGKNIYYYVNGTQLFEQTVGNDYGLHFFYDRNGELTSFVCYTAIDEPIHDFYYYVKNAQGDITGITDCYGNLVASYEYDPWGKIISVTGSNLEIANLNPFRYRSYYYDSDIQMYYLQSRYYDPEVGRFINCDDVNYIGVTESEVSYNPFAYCENDPVNYNDYTGNRTSASNVIKTNFKSDEFGRTILKHYLTGKGKELKIVNNIKWTNYLNSSYMCQCPNHDRYEKITLQKYISSVINKHRASFPTKYVVTKKFKVSAAIPNGEGIIGRNYLHGTNNKVGGLGFSVQLTQKNQEDFYAITVTWNDIIDPNFNYKSDSRKYAIASRLPIVNPRDYIIRISWVIYLPKKLKPIK